MPRRVTFSGIMKQFPYLNILILKGETLDFYSEFFMLKDEKNFIEDFNQIRYMKVLCNKTFDPNQEEKKEDEEAIILKYKTYLLALFEAIKNSKFLEHAYFEIKLEIKYRDHLEVFLEDALKQKFSKFSENKEITLTWDNFLLLNDEKPIIFYASSN